MPQQKLPVTVLSGFIEKLRLYPSALPQWQRSEETA